MSNNRPKIKVPFETVDYVMEFIAIALLLIMWGFVFINHSELPSNIPSHFNAKGEVDNYSSKTILWLLPAIGTAIYIGLFFLNRYPHLHNYNVNINEDNALPQYRFSMRVLRFTNIFTAFVIGFVVYEIIQVAKTNADSTGYSLLAIILIFTFLFPIGILLMRKRLNKTHG